jgi:hypothetical protein
MISERNASTVGLSFIASPGPQAAAWAALVGGEHTDAAQGERGSCRAGDADDRESQGHFGRSHLSHRACELSTWLGRSLALPMVASPSSRPLRAGESTGPPAPLSRAAGSQGTGVAPGGACAAPSPMRAAASPSFSYHTTTYDARNIARPRGRRVWHGPCYPRRGTGRFHNLLMLAHQPDADTGETPVPHGCHTAHRRDAGATNGRRCHTGHRCHNSRSSARTRSDALGILVAWRRGRVT